MAGPAPDPHNKIPGIGTTKPKKAEKSYWFDLKLCESNDETYPEFFWSELVSERKNKEVKERVAGGRTALNPYASDDEDDLKAMAARFEAKYNGKPVKKNSKRKLLAEDYIDRGAGYDESDSFIDNTDVYDEVVPADLETVRGGFYINQGSLDFREVDISDEEIPEDVDGKINNNNKNGKIPPLPTTTTITTTTTASSIEKNPPAGIVKPGIKRPSLLVTNKNKLLPGKIKSKDGKSSKLSSNQKSNGQLNNNNNNNKSSESNNNGIPTNKKSNPSSVQDSSSTESSTSGGSSSSEESSTSSDSSSSGEDEEEEEEEEKAKATSKKEVQKSTAVQKQQQPLATNSLLDPSAPPVKRLKTKNVPLNPNLPKNKILVGAPSSSCSASPSTILNNSKEIIVTTTSNTSPSSSKLTPHPGQSISPQSITSSLGLTITPGTIPPPPSAMKVPTPKSTPTAGSGSNTNNSSSALNLVRSSGGGSGGGVGNKIKSQHAHHHHHTNSSKAHNRAHSNKAMKMNLPLITQLNQAAAADLMQNLALASTLQAAANAQNSALNSKLKVNKGGGGSGGKVKHLKNLSSSPSKSSLAHQSHGHGGNVVGGGPPKLKAKPKLNPNNLPTSSAASLMAQHLVVSQALSSSPFGRISQPPPLSAQTIEITKIKPIIGNPHSSSSSSTGNLNTSIKSLSNLGSGITVTEVKDKTLVSHPHLSPVVGSSSSAGTAAIITTNNNSGNSNNPRSRSPNVVNSIGGGGGGGGSSRLSQSLTITPSALLNLSNSGAHNLMNSGDSGSNNSIGGVNLTTTNSSSTNPSSMAALANLNMMPPSSRNSLLFGGGQGTSGGGASISSSSSSRKTMTPFNINNILPQNDLMVPTSSATSNHRTTADLLNQQDLTTLLAYNMYMQNKK